MQTVKAYLRMWLRGTKSPESNGNVQSAQVHYDRYNKRFGKDGIHETLTWAAQTKDVEEFKEKFIYPEMIEGEVKVISFSKVAKPHFEHKVWSQAVSFRPVVSSIVLLSQQH